MPTFIMATQDILGIPSTDEYYYIILIIVYIVARL